MHGLIFETSVCYWQNQPGCYLYQANIYILNFLIEFSLIFLRFKIFISVAIYYYGKVNLSIKLNQISGVFLLQILPREAINKALIVSHLRDIALDLKYRTIMFRYLKFHAFMLSLFSNP